EEFVGWLEVPEDRAWLDVGSGAGDVTLAILSGASPTSVQAVDLSAGYVAYARQRVSDQRASFAIDDAQSLETKPDSSFDAVVSGLALNFVREPESAVKSMARVARTGGCVAAYVWDYADQMQLMRYFWDAVLELFPESSTVDEAARFPFCNPDGLTRMWESAGLTDIETRAIDVPTVFRDFEDFWTPFLGGQGSAPTFAMSLTETDRSALGSLIGSRLPYHDDGSIHLIARAWAVRGTVRSA
ncbi:MAG: class I SAM-dependent methyltransferase, partial [Thermomicrobiales bacterium]